MNKKISKNSISLIATIFIATVSFGLFYAWQNLETSTGNLQRSIPGLSEQEVPDSVESRKSIASGDKYFAAKDYLNAKSAYQMAIDQNPGDKTAQEKLRKTMELLRSQKAQNILFDVAIASADKLFQAGDYDKAKIEYENASKMLPGDPYPKNKINEIIKAQVDKKVKDDEYAKAVASADKSFVTNNLQLALLDYKKANTIKPLEKYPQTRIKEITDLLTAQKAKDDAYNKAILIADQNFKDVRYPDAIKSYKDALAIKPEQVYPKNKISEIEGLMARIKKAQEDYEKFIAMADSLYIEKQYFKARESYVAATSVKPSESYPKEMISKADKMLTGQEAAMARALEEQYSKAIAGADKLLAEKSYEPARAEYLKASNLKPGEQYPKDKIQSIDDIFASAAKNIDEQYKMAIANGDKALANKGYELAKNEFQTALKIKPAESYPKTKIGEIDKLIAAEALKKAEDSKYTHAIAKGDSLFFLKIYQPARTEFVAALKMKPTEAYPRNRIADIDAALAEVERQKVRDAQYQALIAKADKGFTEKSYTVSREDYVKASALKQEEGYPKERIAEIDRIFADLAAAKRSVEENYQAAIKSADQFLADKSYEQALTDYKQASSIKPVEQYPKGKISEIEVILATLAKQKAADDEYSRILAIADKLNGDKSWTQAKTEYQNALKIKTAELYPKEQIAAIDKILADLAKDKELYAKYSAAIVKADNLLAQKNYPVAKVAYQDASALKADEVYPKEKIAEIDKILGDIAAAKQSLEENYQSTIARADQLFNSKTYDQAKTEYSKALELKPAESYPKTKISEIDLALAEIAKIKALDEQYTIAVEAGDKLLADKLFNDAKVKYQTALKLKPSEKYPAEKIAEIDKTLADLSMQKGIEDQYAAAIQKADNLLSQKNYPGARAEYTSAASIKPDEKYPSEKIAEIDKTVADIAAAKLLDENYKSLIAKADQLFTAKSYTDARVEYENALKIKSAEQHPQVRIAEIEKILADLAAKKSLDENYQTTIARADQLLASKSYDQAKAEFGKALGLKPAEQYPKTKIAEIDGALAEIARLIALDEQYASAIESGDKLLADKSYTEAKVQYQAALKLKPGEKYPTDKITEADKALAELARLKAIDDQYASALQKADNLLSQKNYPGAKSEYTNASVIKPNENYPKEKITEIDKTLAELAAAKALDDTYKGHITRADQLMTAKSYPQARTEYEDALKLKPAEQYPQSKIAEIGKILADLDAQKVLDENYKATIAKADQLLAAKTYDQAKSEYEKALTLKASEQYPKSKVAEIETILAAIAKQKALDETYAATVANADKLLAEKSYEAAKTDYQKATGLKPSEQYPKTKIAEIEKALLDVARLKAIDEQYSAEIANADKLLQAKTYADAKEAYNRAGKIKPAEQYPKDKVAEIDGILTALAKQKALDDQYSAAITKADQLLTSKSYDQAKAEYVTALNLKPDEVYPKEKIAEIEKAMAAIKALEDSYKAAIANADQLFATKKYEEARVEYQNALTIKPQATYPKEKIGDINRALEELLGKQKFYDNLIVDADKLFNEKDYSKAKDNYQRASGVFPEQTYPKDRLKIITSRIDSLYRANKSRYDKAVADGDRFFNSFEFDKSIDAFTEAANLLTMESYPREMILKIRRTIAENAIADVLQTAVTISSNDEKQFAFTPVNIASRKNNFVYIKIKNLSGKPFNVLMRYGRDKQPNGGIVMRNITIDGKVNERLVSVKDQDLWSREDNNWISISPQGGDVEVSFIQVSRAKLD